MPQTYGAAPAQRPSAAQPAAGSGYFSSFSSAGTVYNLNTGEYLNKP